MDSCPQDLRSPLNPPLKKGETGLSCPQRRYRKRAPAAGSWGVGGGCGGGANSLGNNDEVENGFNYYVNYFATLTQQLAYFMGFRSTTSVLLPMTNPSLTIEPFRYASPATNIVTNEGTPARDSMDSQ
jgi:hypothetical protein